MSLCRLTAADPWLVSSLHKRLPQALVPTRILATVTVPILRTQIHIWAISSVYNFRFGRTSTTLLRNPAHKHPVFYTTDDDGKESYDTLARSGNTFCI